MIAPGTQNVGSVWAISAETGKTRGNTSSARARSLVATGGGLVFGGDANGRFRAFDDRNGKVLWEVNRFAGQRFPVTFAVDGKQYVAVNRAVARRGI